MLCEIVNEEDGSMSRLPQLRVFAEKHGLKMVLISDMVGGVSIPTCPRSTMPWTRSARSMCKTLRGNVEAKFHIRTPERYPRLLNHKL